MFLTTKYERKETVTEIGSPKRTGPKKNKAGIKNLEPYSKNMQIDINNI